MKTSEKIKRSKKNKGSEKRSEKIKRSDNKPAPTESGLDQSSASKAVKKRQDDSIKWTKMHKKLIKTAIKSAVDTYLLSNVKAPLSTRAGKDALSDFVLTNIGATHSKKIKSSARTADVVTPHKTSEDHLEKNQSLNSMPVRHAQISTNSEVDVPTTRKANDSLSNHISHLSLEAKSLDDINDEIVIKKREVGESEAMTTSDPGVFTIRLGVVNDKSFAILFNDKRVLEGLAGLSPREKLQLIHDAIHHDPGIPDRKLTRPWITRVTQLNDGCLSFRTETKHDVHTVTTNIQWARTIRDTIAAGVKTYKLVIKDGEILKFRIKDYKDSASIIDKIRKENTERVPSITQVGAIRDIMLQEGQVQEAKLDSHAQYIVTFGSREAANAALDMGLFLYSKYCPCVVYSPMTQWHQQCANCKKHGHIAKDCLSLPVCGKCSSNHQTQHCRSAITECPNCHGRHVAFSKTCPIWLAAEENAHRAYRFPAEEPSIPRTRTEAKNPTKTTPPPPALPPTAPKHIAQPAATTSKTEPPSSTAATPSALLQTIDAFRAFVAARETETSKTHTPAQKNPTRKKRKMEEPPENVHQYMMTGALQVDGHDGKRVKREEAEEEEGPVWPIGQSGYEPLSLVKRERPAMTYEEIVFDLFRSGADECM